MSTTLSEIWYTRCPVPTPVGLAAQLGYLEQNLQRGRHSAEIHHRFS
ncbi:hypothetical protein QE453_000406 [Agrobacterium sp. SORGH_AS440]|nr:hypothetical protein [Agrobacterium sp. SORGH_AS_0440]